ncbi:NAD(P)/FAD-dependent oxidoreductase [Pseudochryseolinea flava]|uniref:NAD(P)/FAD-dependent oxidoreductase n=2 Tax=Pseudochryseolinea flava TaxID=2059302 RepID=A0A364Y6G5_9BACT|nr:NAD(P)/FAD-dependent oxidoreductase [Pseudochryseolinea flava]
MNHQKNFDVIVVGGSYAGLAAGMALGRSLRNTLIIDAGKPCNRQTPHSHNFITHDGRPPKEIAILAKQQVEKYERVKFFDGFAVDAQKKDNGFQVTTDSGDVFSATKLIFTTGIKDILPAIDGFAECWGITVIHCPYCHGYEVRDERTGIFANGDAAFEFGSFISNWTKDLTVFTNGKSTLTAEQTAKLLSRNIAVVETEFARLEHDKGQLKHIVFKDGSTFSLKAMYARTTFEQHSAIPQQLGCEMTEDGYIKIDPIQKTSVAGVFAAGDNTTRMRTVANAVSTGAIAGMMANKDFILESF